MMKTCPVFPASRSLFFLSFFSCIIEFVFEVKRKARQTFNKLNFSALRNQWLALLGFRCRSLITDRCSCQSKSQIPSCQGCAICLSAAIETKSECDMVSSSGRAGKCNKAIEKRPRMQWDQHCAYAACVSVSPAI